MKHLLTKTNMYISTQDFQFLVSSRVNLL